MGTCKSLQKGVFRLNFYTLQLYKMKTNNENNFDFLDDLDLTNEKPKNKQDLRDYLDGFSFVSEHEVSMAVNDFFMEEMGIMNPSYGDLMEYAGLTIEYIKNKNLKF